MGATPRNIQERTFEFGVRVIRLVDRLPRTIAGMKIGQQLIESGTSIGANMQEADAAESKKILSTRPASPSRKRRCPITGSGSLMPHCFQMMQRSKR